MELYEYKPVRMVSWLYPIQSAIKTETVADINPQKPIHGLTNEARATNTQTNGDWKKIFVRMN